MKHTLTAMQVKDGESLGVLKGEGYGGGKKNTCISDCATISIDTQDSTQQDASEALSADMQQQDSCRLLEN